MAAAVVTRRSPDLIGREAEAARLDALLEELPGHGGALVISGEPGIGKSALLSRLRERAGAKDFRVLTTTGIEAEAELPYSGLQQLLRPIAGSIDSLPRAQRRTLEAALGITADAEPNPFRVGTAALELVSSAGDAKPLVLIIDDAHWLDLCSRDALQFVARRVEWEPVAVVAAMRSDSRRGFEDSRLPTLELTRLSPAAAAEVLDSTAPGLHPIARAHVLAEAAGNPLALVELGRTGTQSPPPADESAPLTTSLNTRLLEAFAFRLGGLPPGTRSAVLAAALDSRASLSDVLRAASLVEGSTLSLDALQPAVDAGLVELADHQLRFRHPLIRAAVRQAAGRAELIAAHHALAQIVDEPVRNLWHRASACIGRDEDIATALDEHARAMKRHGAVTAAAAAFERAATLTADPRVRGERLLRAAEVAYELGRRDAVQRLLSEAGVLDLGRTASAQVGWLQQVTSGDFWSERGAARTFVTFARQLADAGDADFALESLEPIAHRCWWTPCQTRTREYVVDTAMSLGTHSHDARVLAVSALAHPEKMAPQVLRTVADLGPPSDSDPLTAMYAGIAAEKAGDFALAARFHAVAVRGLRSQARLGVLTKALTHYAWAATYADEWEAATIAAQEAAGLARETEEREFGVTAEFIAALAAALRGDTSEVELHLAHAPQVHPTLRSGPLTATSHIARGAAALGEGRYDDAFEQMWPVFDERDSAFHRFMRWPSLLDLVEAAVHSGNAGRIGSVVSELEETARCSGPPILRAGLACAAPLLASDADAEARFTAALDQNLTSFPFLRARTLFSFGSWLRRRRRSADARRLLRAGVERFDALGARLWSNRARQELRATGETIGARTPELRERLTTQELQIARLAAEGLSNREIGERLFLSHRTVGSHLYRIFPKLGITARAQLHQRLATAPELADSIV